ncbi:auxin-induced protein 15A [Gossypium raimondii]|nr:auxin-induced protein 15A [Gossypium raimondii]
MSFSLLIRPQQYVPSPLIPFGPLTSIYTSMIMFICNTYLHILKVLQFSEIFFYPFEAYLYWKTTMAIRLPHIVGSKKVPKGYFAVYVGENQKRFVIPVSFLSQPLFQDLLGMSQEEFGYSHPTGGLAIPCNEDIFLDVTSRLN